MNERSFVERRQNDWTRLSQLCDRAEVSPSRLSPDELHELVRLYRRVSNDLAAARTWSNNLPLIERLNELAVRGYAVLYRAPRRPFGPALRESVARAAQTVRRQIVFVLVSALVFFGSGLFSFWGIRAVPALRDVFVSPEMEPMFQNWTRGGHQDRGTSADVGMLGLYASNNPRVAILTAAVGAGTLGFGSLWLLQQNGTMVGALASDMAEAGKLGFLAASLGPHGIPELSGVVVAGAAGLLLAWACIRPGRRPRGAALRAAGPDVMALILTSVVLMLIAAPIEGFFSFNPAVPDAVKAVVAVLEAGAWAAFWVGYGRN